MYNLTIFVSFYDSANTMPKAVYITPLVVRVYGYHYFMYLWHTMCFMKGEAGLRVSWVRDLIPLKGAYIMARRRARNARPSSIREGLLIAPIDQTRTRRVPISAEIHRIAEDFASGINPSNKEDWDLWLRYVKTHQATAKTVRVRVKKTDVSRFLEAKREVEWHGGTQ